jgi:hypothetical protein
MKNRLGDCVTTDRDDQGRIRTENGVGVYTHLSATRFCPELPFVEKRQGVEYQQERVEGALEEQEKFWEKQIEDYI